MGQKRSSKKGNRASLAEQGNEVGPAKYRVASETPQEMADRELKYTLYQRAVQAPKGDISYLSRFFLDYVGRRAPLHLHEDFCGSALICTEWLRGDPRRTALGLDLDEEALLWGARHNLASLPGSGGGRAVLLCGNVLHSLGDATPVCIQEPTDPPERTTAARELEDEGAASVVLDQKPDIICAFNFSTCCLQSRGDLLQYFAGVVQRLRGSPAASTAGEGATEGVREDEGEEGTGRRRLRAGQGPRGGVFAMDLYGGTSSECALKIQRKYGDFDYTWEQEGFDAVTRRTSIALHFRLNNSPALDGAATCDLAEPGCRKKGPKRGPGKGGRRVIKNAFSYQWRLWTIPEVSDCLREVGFDDVRVWMRKRPDAAAECSDSSAGSGDESELENDFGEAEEVSVDGGAKVPFTEVQNFYQCDSWNAYIVGVCH